MTTIENSVNAVELIDLSAACEKAGIGGTVRNTEVGTGTLYVVAKLPDGNWALDYETDVIDIAAFQQEGWLVVSTATDGEETEQDTKPATYQDFFEGLPTWSYFWDGRNIDCQYIFTGWKQNKYGDNVPAYVHHRYMTTSLMSILDLDHECQWEAFTVNGTPKEASRDLRQAIRTMYSALKEAESYKQLHKEEGERLEAVKRDFRKLNEHINSYAEETHMCGDYERRIYGWNETFEVMELEGRVRDYNVPVRVPGVFGDTEVWVSGIKARTPEEAREQVQRMTAQEVLNNLYQSGYSMPEWTVGDSTPRA
ncbi:hypothetical protein SEND513_53 [Mycobacterium phage Send513]|uniref:Uncharacterized protein n=1 Tax=Mycobacterium phage Send513 TaxID=1034146 RepID=G1BRN1_9CAUD|nr:hypothetical protein FDI62_gp53 [Mycobacterium phage Send513]AEK07498.1 hypothetical protein SEND513_53 [Mycobacterium phage Send513]